MLNNSSFYLREKKSFLNGFCSVNSFRLFIKLFFLQWKQTLHLIV